MSGGLAPSKSTVYVSNLPFSLTNNDLFKIFEKYGKIVKVTVVKDKVTHKSKGVAFVLYLERESAYSAVKAINNKEMFGRTLKCSIAVDNGRASEFIRRRYYVDKSKCYECGETGHMSYSCPHNSLGDREPPKKKPKKRRRRNEENEDGNQSFDDEDSAEEEVTEDPSLDTLSAAIEFERNLVEEEEYRKKVASGDYSSVNMNANSSSSSSSFSNRKRIRPNSYFSDEEEEEND